MSNGNDDQELKVLFRALRRDEAKRTPSFERMSRKSPARTQISWRYVAGTALAAVVLFFAGTIFFKSPNTPPAAMQPDASALAASAMRIVSTWPGESTPPLRWDSPTAFLLAPLTDGRAPENSGSN